MNFIPKDLSINQLLLDPNNYRFLDMEKYKVVSEKRYHEPNVQKRAQELIEENGREELRALKESILINGFIPLEVIVVKKYMQVKDTYVVVEGNRRIAAMRWIIQDREHGVEVTKSLVAGFQKLSVIILDPKNNSQNFAHVLMGLRHVSGVKQWGSYQRAQLIVELVDQESLAISDAAKSIGMSSHEAARRYRAYKALNQMQDDEEFSSYAQPDKMYAIFHEAVAQPKIKDWLKWDDNNFKFLNEESLHEFYKMLISMPRDDEDGSPTEPKIKTKDEVRNLKDLLGNADALESLLDPSQTLADALAIVKADEMKWVPRLKSALQSLEKLPVETLKKLDGEEISVMHDLYKALKSRLDDYAKLTDKKLKL